MKLDVKRLISLMLAMLLFVGMVPVDVVFAASATEETAGITNDDIVITSGNETHETTDVTVPDTDDIVISNVDSQVLVNVSGSVESADYVTIGEKLPVHFEGSNRSEMPAKVRLYFWTIDAAASELNAEVVPMSEEQLTVPYEAVQIEGVTDVTAIKLPGYLNGEAATVDAVMQNEELTTVDSETDIESTEIIGRYLEIEVQPDQTLVLDFNLMSDVVADIAVSAEIYDEDMQKWTANSIYECGWFVDDIVINDVTTDNQSIIEMPVEEVSDSNADNITVLSESNSLENAQTGSEELMGSMAATESTDIIVSESSEPTGETTGETTGADQEIEVQESKPVPDVSYEEHPQHFDDPSIPDPDTYMDKPLYFKEPVETEVNPYGITPFSVNGSGLVTTWVGTSVRTDGIAWKGYRSFNGYWMYELQSDGKVHMPKRGYGTTGSITYEVNGRILHMHADAGTNSNGDKVTGVAYCVQPHRDHQEGTHEAMYWEDGCDVSGEYLRDPSKRRGVTRALVYGAPNNADLNSIKVNGKKVTPEETHNGTHLLVLDVITGYRDEFLENRSGIKVEIDNKADVDAAVESSGLPYPSPMQAAFWYSQGTDAEKAVYRAIVQAYRDRDYHNKAPSFCGVGSSDKAPVQELKIQSDGSYSITLKDENMVLIDYGFPQLSGVSFTKSGNDLTIKVNANSVKTYLNKVTAVHLTGGKWYKINHEKNGDIRLYRSESDYDAQHFAMLVQAKKDPVDVYLRFTLKESKGYLEVQKSSSDPNFSAANDLSLKDASYGIYTNASCDSASRVESMKTNKNGYAKSNALDAGEYWVKEDYAPAGYHVDPNKYGPYTVGNNATETVQTVESIDVVKQGFIEISKKSSDGSLTDGNPAYSLKDAEYGVYTDKACNTLVTVIKTNDKGYGKSKALPEGSYYVKEIKAPAGFELDKNVYGSYPVKDNSIASDDIVTVNVKDNPMTIGLKLVKKSSNSGVTGHNSAYSLAGAVYGVYTDKNCASEVGRIVTDANGVGSLSNLPMGTYYLREIEAPAGYELDKTIHGPFTIDENFCATHQELKVEVEEIPQMGHLEIIKASSDPSFSNGKPQYSLANAHYGVYTDQACRNKVDELVTVSNGYAKSKELPLGQYYIKEITPPENYQLDKTVYGPYMIQANPDAAHRIVHGDTEDNPQYGYIKIEKKSAEPSVSNGNKEYSLADAEFEIRDSNGQLVDTLVTDANGKDTSIKLPVGDYTVTEVKSPKGFQLGSEGGQKVTIKPDKTVELEYYTKTAVNELKKGIIEIDKKSDRPEISDNNPEYSLAGADYGVYKTKQDALANKNAVDHIITDKTGHGVTSKKLPLGEYWIREVKAPEGFMLDDTVYGPYHLIDTNVGSNTKDHIVHDDVKDKPYYGRIELEKLSADMDYSNDPENPEANQHYSLQDAEYTVYQGHGTAGKVVATLKTDAHGHAVSGDLPLGEYTVKETKAPKGFKIDETEYYVTITKGTVQQIQVKKVTSEDVPKTGIFELTKVSDYPEMTDGSKCYSLKDAEYTIYWDEECQNIVRIPGVKNPVVTDENGIAKSDPLPLGHYYIKETKASEGYDLDKTVHEVIIVEAECDKIQVVLSKERPKNDPGGIEITKTNKGEKTETMPPLVGAEFTVKYYDGYYKESELTGLEPTRTWILVVDEHPKDPTRYITGFEDKYLAEDSDPLYKNERGREVLPLGTYTIQETKPAAGYHLKGGKFKDQYGNEIDSDKMYYTQVTDTSSGVKLTGGNVFEAENEPDFTNIKIKKYDPDGIPIQGVVFTLKGEVNTTVLTATTDDRGIAEFNHLPPDIYTLEELKTEDGMMLLKDPIIIKAPARLTKNECDEYHVDMDKVKYCEAEDMYLIFDFVYEITNTPTLIIPMTGGFVTAKTFLPLAGGMGLFSVAAAMGFGKKKKKKH